jgi:hypothetical protein
VVHFSVIKPYVGGTFLLYQSHKPATSRNKKGEIINYKGVFSITGNRLDGREGKEEIFYIRYYKT